MCVCVCARARACVRVCEGGAHGQNNYRPREAKINENERKYGRFINFADIVKKYAYASLAYRGQRYGYGAIGKF